MYIRKLRQRTMAAALAAVVAAAGAYAGPTAAAAEETVTASIDLSSIKDEYTGVTVEEADGYTLFTIGEDGVYRLSGEGKGVLVEVAEGKTVTLELKDATLDNSALTTGKNDAAIYGNKGCDLTIALSGNSVMLGNPENGELSDAIGMKKSENTLTINGTGSLSISGNDGDGIQFKKGTVVIQSGTLTMEAIGGDGIQAENVTITGGDTSITTAYENASTQYYTSGTSSVEGKNTIWEQNNGETKYERINVDTGSHKGLKVGTKGRTEEYLDGTESETTEASGTLTITGGTLTIDTTNVGLKANSVSGSGYTATSTGVYIIGSPDDAISSNNDIFISGGELKLASSDDGISAAGTLSITGDAAIEIETSYEGLEGKDILVGTKEGVDAPSVIINSKDDGINAASKSLTYTYDSAENEDENYLKYSVRNEGNSCVLNSGSVTVKIDSVNEKSVVLNGKTIGYKCSGDGIDCNGALDIEGGEHFVYGQSAGDNSPIDTDDGFTLNKAATVLLTGGQGMGNETYPSGGDGVYLVYTGEGSQTAVLAGSSNGTNPGGGQPGGNTPPGGDGTTRPEDDGTAPSDGMTPPDGGMTPPDGGMTPPDGGMTPPDGGMTPPDSGTTPPDGGMTPPDGGMTPPGQQGGSFSAGQVAAISDGSTTLYSLELPYAAAMLFYASPKLVSGSSYTLSLDKTEAPEESTEDPEESTEGQEESTEGQEESTEGQEESTEGQEESTEGQEESTEGQEEETDPETAAIEEIQKAGVDFVEVTAKKKKIKVTLAPTTIEGASYEIQYRKGNGAWKTVTSSDTAVLLKKLKRKKKYTLMVRLVKEINGTTYTSAWSAETTVKTK
ncbi:MAG: carbohydrate-binding domain-containing protein [Lachnospiraceae bacterium]|nr:carbohydrate-binding domain-containing protein [Lachnospiraceae bacterium]